MKQLADGFQEDMTVLGLGFLFKIDGRFMQDFINNRLGKVIHCLLILFVEVLQTDHRFIQFGFADLLRMIAQFDDGAKIEVTLLDQSKTFICNKTNATTISTAFGKETVGWHGHDVILYPMMVPTPSGPKEAIRVRMPSSSMAQSVAEGLSRAQPQGHANVEEAL